MSRWIDAELDPGGDSGTLDEAVRTADALVRDNYPPGPRRMSAEVQYAIYPWAFEGKPAAIFDVTGKAGELVASDILKTSLGVGGTTADDLVVQASLVLAGQPRAMFRWLKKVRDLTNAE